MKALVTGGAGYIGSVMAARLVAEGHETVVADNLSRGHIEAIPPGATFKNMDLLDTGPIKRLLGEDFDAVFHFAALALVAESVESPEIYYRTNVGGTLNLLESMMINRVTKLVFSSTAAVYGEPDDVPILESAPARPCNPYGASKLAVDGMIGDFCAAHGLGAVSLRYFNVAGATTQGEDHEPETHLIPNILRSAMDGASHVTIFGADYPTPDGTCIRDYVHVEDLATAHLLACDHIEAGRHDIFNLGNGAGFSVKEVIDAASSVTGKTIPSKEGPRRRGDPPALVASSEKIKTTLGWNPAKADIHTIIKDAWNWMQDHPKGYS